MSVVRTEAISKYKVDAANTTELLPMKLFLKEEALGKKLEKNAARWKRLWEGINEEVSEQAQALYSELDKQYAIEWGPKNAIHFKEFKMDILPPYTAEALRGGNDERARERVKHIIHSFSLKLKKK
eukprot:TRINITY_DN6761_c0_g1_i4.p3 TRINITY_DN6761_c0_g1~~TRINITY_DN6761_c0_g1_i4.p3  ORF type:complete len:126 (+),score=21.18 TRINITY_DN6761_c0_g1_i4:178-555(+)